MKKQILLATAAALVTTSVYATKARMQGLGQDADYGSLYIKDTRNVFRNASTVNHMRNYVVTEWGTAASAEGTESDPNAEGGFFREAGSFVYGVYLGSDRNTQNDKRTGTAGNGYAEQLAGSTNITFGNANLQDSDNELDLFFGGDMGVEWGVRLNYASNKTNTGATNTVEADQSAFGLGLGATMGDLQGWVNLQLSDESENLSGTTGTSQTSKWEADTGINVGVSYMWMDTTFYVDYDKRGAEYTTAGATSVTGTTEQSTWRLGAGHIKELSSTSRLFMDGELRLVNAEDQDGQSGNTAQSVEVDRTLVPLTVGFEADATSWLTLRGSIKQNIIIGDQEVSTDSSTANNTVVTAESTISNSTDVEAGMTLDFGKLKVDGVIGTTGDGGASATSSETGRLALDRLATRVAVHYWF